MTIQTAAESFIAWKRSRGLVFETGAKLLRSFCRYTKGIELQELTLSSVRQFLTKGTTSTLTYVGKESILRCFFEYCELRGMRKALPVPKAFVRPRPTFSPHIYTRHEISLLLKGVHGNQGHGLAALNEKTFRTSLLLLYGTGMRVGELRSLNGKNVDLQKGLVTITGRNPGFERTIPLCSDLVRVMRSYSEFKARRGLTCESFLITKTNGRIGPCTFGRCFRRLLLRTGMRGSVGSQPSMRDFRATFAVHRITSWIRGCKDLNRMLPALSAYMGLSRLDSTERYMTLVPERFRRQLNVLSPSRNRMPWKRDSGLLQFLTAL